MYTNKKESSVRIGPVSSRVQNTESIIRLMKELQNDDALFFEMEPVEVIEVHNDPTTSTYPKLKDGTPDFGMVGSIMGRYIQSETGDNIDRLKTFKPMNPLFNSTPVIGELVIGMEYLGQRFYLPTLNLKGNTTQSIIHNLSKGAFKDTLDSKQGKEIERKNDDDLSTGKDFKKLKDTDPRRLSVGDGDFILQGRFGNAIRMGSDIKNDKLESSNILLSTGLNKEGEVGTKDKIGEPITETPDKDGSVLYLVSKQPLDENNKLTYTIGKESELVTELSTFEDSQVYIGSDRIILNTKNNGDILLSSNNNIGIASKTSTVIESPSVLVGGIDASHPVAFGDVVEEVFNKVFSILEKGLLAPTGPVQVVPGVADLTAAKTAVGKMLSTIHKTK